MYHSRLGLRKNNQRLVIISQAGWCLVVLSTDRVFGLHVHEAETTCRKKGGEKEVEMTSGELEKIRVDWHDRHVDRPRYLQW
jgi:hypothetical protein